MYKKIKKGAITMKKKTFKNKLNLNKKTISNLERQQMSNAKGGKPTYLVTDITWCLCTVATECWTCGTPVSYCICPY
jgi:hypothetical protein